jgi:hypothetical protein
MVGFVNENYFVAIGSFLIGGACALSFLPHGH